VRHEARHDDGSPTVTLVGVEVLAEPVWRAREAAHAARVDAATAAHQGRRATATPHPVEDFLFTYYHHSVGALRRWHPGAGVVLEGGATTDRAHWRFVRLDHDGVTLDLPDFLAERGERVRAVDRLVRATAGRAPQYGCFGLHEWAMVHRIDQTEVRHPTWPLRLGGAGTDAVVESHPLVCTHHDAFRFFTPTARPLNAQQPTRADQVALEQPGCLHASMDLHKWALKLGPAVPGDLALDCFDLARDVRRLDMQASPYDLAALGEAPVAIETAEGKAEYVTRQRGFAERAAGLRARLSAVCVGLLERAAAPADPSEARRTVGR
jgi:hypothetical protein